jgi:uncharacterized protein (DUF1330 family)
MPAYIIVELSVIDKEGYEEYKKSAPSSISSYGGKYIIRGGQTENLEGDWQPERIAVLEFPTSERAREWWNSEMYSRAKSIRQRTAKTKMILVEGV